MITKCKRHGMGVVLIGVVLLGGCGPGYRNLRREGQQAMIAGNYGPARVILAQAEDKRPRNPENLYDLAMCSMMLAQERMEQRNQPAAMRELDAAIAYFDQAISANPAHFPSIEGKSIALKLKGQYNAALEHAEWAATFVGPSARQYLFLARELEERGDIEGAMLRYRQAVAIQPSNPEIHTTFAGFLLRHNHEPAAVHHLQAAYRLNPGNTWVADELHRRGAIPTLASDQPATSPRP
jgi:tetratricopeptide (TPR) repeat protein